jgi:hypothetical protein
MSVASVAAISNTSRVVTLRTIYPGVPAIRFFGPLETSVQSPKSINFTRAPSASMISLELATLYYNEIIRSNDNLHILREDTVYSHISVNEVFVM